MTPETKAALLAVSLDPDQVTRLVRVAIDEDLAGGEDVTSTATIDPNSTSAAEYVVRGHGVLAGMPVLAAVLEIGLPADAKIAVFGSDGERVVPGTVIARVTSKTIPLLTIERTSLNVISRLCGVATLTRQWVDAVASSAAKIRDTRKTTPGLRALEKYAVRCGGGVNHRMGLHDAVLIKDNHVVAAGGVGAALDDVHRRYGITPGQAKSGFAVQVEVDSFAQLDEALDHGVTQLLLDNMTLDEMTEAVRRVRARNAHVLVEASGGLALANAAEVAATGVDFLAVGALTHSAPILDIALDFAEHESDFI